MGNTLLEQQWCGGVGMAERFDATAVVGQEMCREDVLLHVDRGQFKEPRFPRTLKFYNFLSTNVDKYDSWFSLVGQTRSSEPAGSGRGSAAVVRVLSG